MTQCKSLQNVDLQKDNVSLYQQNILDNWKSILIITKLRPKYVLPNKICDSCTYFSKLNRTTKIFSQTFKQYYDLFINKSHTRFC